MKKIACYPGSFDPITDGHVEIIKRALKLFDQVYVLVANNSEKSHYFSVEERVKMIEEAFAGYDNLFVTHTSGLVVNRAKELGSNILIRGLRAVSDFEYEFQVAAVNEYIDSNIETVFLISRRQTSFISSSQVKELYFHGQDISQLVPKSVVEGFKKKDIKGTKN